MRKKCYRFDAAHRVETLLQKLESSRRLEDRKKHQVRMLKKAKEMPRDYTVDAQACHVYDNNAAGKECWCIMVRITSQSIGHRQLGPGLSLHVAEVTCVLLTTECCPLWITSGLGVLKSYNNSQHLPSYLL